MDAIANTTRLPDSAVDDSITHAAAWLEQNQNQEGYWAGLIETNACMEAEWILAMHFLGVENDGKIEKLKKGILDEQRPDGSWEIYHKAPQGDINATVEAYTALRACGMEPEHISLRKARHWILSNGGLSRIRVFTRYWLALLGEWPWEKTPNIPPEIIYCPRWFPFNIYNFSSWARATFLPLSVLSAKREVRRFSEDRRIDELFPHGRDRFDYDLPKQNGAFSWERFFSTLDRLLHFYQNTGGTPGRQMAIKLCLEWIIRHQDSDGAWGGIQPPWIYSLMALNAEGYPATHPIIQKGINTLDDHWSFEQDGAIHIQASESPVWDTLLSIMAMQDCELTFEQSSVMQKAVEYILDKEIRTPGDWQVKVRGVEPSGWAFERANNWYPDMDDTAIALLVLGRLCHSYHNPARIDAVIQRAKNWVLAMQCRNGGWAAFDRDNDKKIITRIPFCDFGEVLDPPSVDVTAHVIEALGTLGMDISDPVIRRAADFIRDQQEPDGGWFGRWGVNYIYGTSAVLCGLAGAGENMQADYIRKAGDWLVSCQNPDGGWGECCGSYVDPDLCGKGESTPSQTGWAIMGLTAIGDYSYREAVFHGSVFLSTRQQDGTWEEPHYTGTGFPGYGLGKRIDLCNNRLSRKLNQGCELSRGFMLRYGMYSHYFPMAALGRAKKYFQSQEIL